MLIMLMNAAQAGSIKAGELQDKKTDSLSEQDASSLSGKVVETMNSGGYTYVNLEKDGNTIWVALPGAEVTVGQEISCAPGMVMNDFQSKTLNRSFDTIVFSSGILGGRSNGTDSKAKGSKGVEAAAEKKAETIQVEKASGSDAYTVAELHEKSTDLNTKSVTVRGQVVKVSPEIMGKNWIHIQDGSGNAAEGTNDILVTSQELPSVGDIVTVQGTLSRDKDFGSGYKYAVIMEEAHIKK